jgi:hypothetical protein
MEYDPQYLQKLEILPEAEKKAKKYGDWHAFEGSVFPEFRPIRYPGEQRMHYMLLNHLMFQNGGPEYCPLIGESGQCAMQCGLL